MKKITGMSNKELVGHYDNLSKKEDVLIAALIEYGDGHMTINAMRESGKEKYKTYLALWDEIVSVILEAKHRYGPDFLYVRQIIQ